MLNWIISNEGTVKIFASALLTLGSIVLAIRVKVLIGIIADVLNAHEIALREIKDISENPRWNNAGRISAAVDDGLKNGMSVAIDKFNARKGVAFLVAGFGSLALGGGINFAIGILMKLSS
ncbi:hypothetical protein EXT60_18400 [Pectobacterium carotovorum subsp. carotovorum]|nr:hypothetical protein [Pectobacterium carotovorum]MCL6366203.1 hypothetical protein [Pectobacterium carotovorum subsp. carotovorum]